MKYAEEHPKPADKICLGTFNSSVNIANMYPDEYMNFTTNNFVAVPTINTVSSVSFTTELSYFSMQHSIQQPSISYDPSSGILSVSNGRIIWGMNWCIESDKSFSCSTIIYLIK